ncbi:MAG: hypothetical protein M3133_04665, partial [Actinomycetota bacterium]|nr:hypothetical protein [Actinomycetota bacterium]
AAAPRAHPRAATNAGVIWAGVVVAVLGLVGLVWAGVVVAVLGLVGLVWAAGVVTVLCLRRPLAARARGIYHSVVAR